MKHLMIALTAMTAIAGSAPAFAYDKGANTPYKSWVSTPQSKVVSNDGVSTGSSFEGFKDNLAKKRAKDAKNITAFKTWVR